MPRESLLNAGDQPHDATAHGCLKAGFTLLPAVGQIGDLRLLSLDLLLEAIRPFCPGSFQGGIQFAAVGCAVRGQSRISAKANNRCADMLPGQEGTDLLEPLAIRLPQVGDVQQVQDRVGDGFHVARRDDLPQAIVGDQLAGFVTAGHDHGQPGPNVIEYTGTEGKVCFQVIEMEGGADVCF